MARRLFKNRLIARDAIKEQLTLIKGSTTDYITPTGQVYKEYEPNLFIKKKTHVLSNGYTYCGITYGDKNIQKRVHRLVAEAYIPNPNNLPFVGHRHNNKSSTDVEELYWTDAAENTKRAYNDGLINNASGIEDSQAYQVDVYSTQGTYIETLGSVSIAAQQYKVSKSTVLRHCRHEVDNIRSKYTFRFFDEEF